MFTKYDNLFLRWNHNLTMNQTRNQRLHRLQKPRKGRFGLLGATIQHRLKFHQYLLNTWRRILKNCLGIYSSMTERIQEKHINSKITANSREVQLY